MKPVGPQPIPLLLPTASQSQASIKSDPVEAILSFDGRVQTRLCASPLKEGTGWSSTPATPPNQPI